MLDGKFHGRRPVGRSQLKWEDNIWSDSLLLLNVTERRRLSEYGDMWRQTIEKARAVVGCSTNEE
jgi:hypothetical protein